MPAGEPLPRPTLSSSFSPPVANHTNAREAAKNTHEHKHTRARGARAKRTYRCTVSAKTGADTCRQQSQMLPGCAVSVILRVFSLPYKSTTHKKKTQKQCEPPRATSTEIRHTPTQPPPAPTTTSTTRLTKKPTSHSPPPPTGLRQGARKPTAK